MVDKGIWKEKDFSKMPSRVVFEKYQYYETLPTSGTERKDYRLQNKDRDNWLVLPTGLKPAQLKDIPTHKLTSVPKTTPTVTVPKTTLTTAPKTTPNPTTATAKTTSTTSKKCSMQDKVKPNKPKYC